uniref:Glycosyltransferase n=1 Tax=Cyclamen purpurascens TaxID=87532 RepID=A0A8D5LS30_9ERIC|nr:UDP-glucose:anthocyanin 5-O-glucosyltransferase [Cyclamen purpurascens]
MENRYRVLLVTFPAQGHINPSLQFAKRLSQMGTEITLLTANFALDRMVTTTPPVQGLTLVGFPDGFDEGLKLGKTMDEIMGGLKNRGSEAVEEIIKSSIEKGEPFSRVVYTTLLPWVGRMAHELKVPSTFLWIQPATLLDIYYYYFNGYSEAIQNHGNDPSWSVELPGLPRLTTRDLPSFFVDSGEHNFALELFKEHFGILELEDNPKVLVNSFDELEYEALRVVKNLNFVPIGPLVPSAFLDGKDPSDNSFGGDLLKKSDDYIEWLNSREKGSVIYVSFGSYSELPKQQMEEIAKGLAATENPFLWVIRKGKKDNENNNFDINMFKEELEKNGENKIVEWCSQMEVLSHPSIGCFVSHCGWNSSLESLVCGVPLVCFPIWTDQSTNAKLIEDIWRVGLRVTKNENGIVEGNEIKTCLDIVMGEKKEYLNINAQKWKKLAIEAAKEHGSSYSNLRDFVDQEIRGVVEY